MSDTPSPILSAEAWADAFAIATNKQGLAPVLIAEARLRAHDRALRAERDEIAAEREGDRYERQRLIDRNLDLEEQIPSLVGERDALRTALRTIVAVEDRDIWPDQYVGEMGYAVEAARGLLGDAS